MADPQASAAAEAHNATHESQEEARLERLREDAEREMRRRLPADAGGGRAAKRHKASEGGTAGAALGGRFDYGALAELERGLTGFLLTCSIQRENSARKEGVPVLARYLQRCQAGDQAAPAEAAAEAERSADAAAAASDAPRLGAIKVSCRGVVALKVAAHPAAAVAAAAGTAAAGDGNAGDASAAAGSAAAAAGSDAEFDAAAATVVLRAAAALLADVEGAARGRLQHVQRVVPVQTTCRLEEAALSRAGSRLASLVAEAAEPGRVGSGQEAASGADGCAGSAAAAAAGEQQQRRLTFGISVKQREGEAAGGGGGLGRGAIISSLAAGFEGALRQRHGIAAAVDLTAPAWVLVVEVLPTGEGQYAALAALPAALCAIKPKLLMRSVGSAAAGGK